MKFGGVTAGAGNITISATTVTFGGAVDRGIVCRFLLPTPTVFDGGGSVNTTAGQTYGAVTLNTDTDLTGTDLTLGTVTGGGFNLGLHGSGDTLLHDVNSVALWRSGQRQWRHDDAGRCDHWSIGEYCRYAVGVNNGVSTTGNQTAYGAATLAKRR